MKEFAVTPATVDTLSVAGVEAILEAWVSGGCTGYCAKGFCDCPEGSWAELGDTWPYPRQPGQAKGTYIDKLGFVETVADVGGMDQGSVRYKVWQIGSRLFRKDGWYASHHGSEFDGAFCQVTAKEKTVIVYE